MKWKQYKKFATMNDVQTKYNVAKFSSELFEESILGVRLTRNLLMI
ncbi:MULTISPECIES: hypothetical protein [Bacillaceae]|nr:hypothetical protein [Cytobacillus sp. IB215316]MDX8359245.1 hypothetical protein [Cytobacillus sp. IB215316]